MLDQAYACLDTFTYDKLLFHLCVVTCELRDDSWDKYAQVLKIVKAYTTGST